MQNHLEEKMIKHARKQSSRKSNKNIKMHHKSENVTKSLSIEDDMNSIHSFSNLSMSDKCRQSTCDHPTDLASGV
jgi:hypothetical protein